MKKKIPPTIQNSKKDLLEQIAELRTQLEEAQQIIKAIKDGHIDALLINGEGSPHVYTLESPDLPYRSIVETMASGAVTLSRDYVILYCNTFFSHMIGIPMQQLTGSSFLHLVLSQHRDLFASFIKRGYKSKSYQELPLKTASGETIYIHLAGGCDLRDPRKMCIVATDISARQKAEESLDIKSRSLEEVNTALRVLLKQREADKSELEENILSNVKELILPYLERLKKSTLDTSQMSSIDIIEGNLRDITSPIMRKIQTFDLTPKEIEVTSYLKSGKTTKQIAELLSVSPRAVEFHRYNIRKKLGLDKKKTNLRSYLLTL